MLTARVNYVWSASVESTEGLSAHSPACIQTVLCQCSNALFFYPVCVCACVCVCVCACACVCVCVCVLVCMHPCVCVCMTVSIKCYNWIMPCSAC